MIIHNLWFKYHDFKCKLNNDAPTSGRLPKHYLNIRRVLSAKGLNLPLEVDTHKKNLTL